VQSIEPDAGRMRAALDEGYLEATDVAEFLVKAGVPFRTAYQAAKLLVQRCVDEQKSLRAITQADLAVHEAFEKREQTRPSLQNISSRKLAWREGCRPVGLPPCARASRSIACAPGYTWLHDEKTL